jgi:hypothetical protein
MTDDDYEERALELSELPGMASHIAYEYAMAKHAWVRLVRLVQPGPPADLEWSAWVEVLVLHSRVLADFFGLSPSRDDVVASHYVEDWDSNHPDVLWIRRYISPINKRVMHLTAYRLRRPGGTDMPSLSELVTRLDSVVGNFFVRLSADQQAWFPFRIEEA